MNLRNDIASRDVHIAFPPHLAADFFPLMISEQAELEAVFGASVRFVETPSTNGPRWMVEQHPGAAANTLRWDADTTTLTSTVSDAAGLASTLQLLHSLVTLDVNKLSDNLDDDLPAAVNRICTEIERGFPGFGTRGLEWKQLRSDFPASHDMTLEDMQQLIARLQDGHTAVRQNIPVYNPPYAVEVRQLSGNQREAILRRVPEWSTAAAMGIEPGWWLELDDLDDWLARSGAPPHAHGLIAGRRAIALNGVSERVFAATSPAGERRNWLEVARPFSLDELMAECVVASNTIYVGLQNWITDIGIEERFDRIIAAHSHRHIMVLDLRGNTGGNLLLAKRMRRRFLRQRTLLGTIQFTRGDGTLADPVEQWGEPAAAGCWPGDLAVLTDGLTFSASEDFLQGLQGLPHITVIGTPTGGGSGRPRTLPLIPGWSVSMSTALTFDRTGRCIEGHGIVADVLLDPFTEEWRAYLGVPKE